MRMRARARVWVSFGFFDSQKLEIARKSKNVISYACARAHARAHARVFMGFGFFDNISQDILQPRDKSI